MKRISHNETKPLTYEQAYEGCQQAYGIKQPDKVSGFMGFCCHVPDIYVYGKAEKWLEQNPELGDEFKGFIKRFMAEDYGFVSGDEDSNNGENRWLCGSFYGSIGRYRPSERLSHYGGFVLEFFRDYGLVYSIEENRNEILNQLTVEERQ